MTPVPFREHNNTLGGAPTADLEPLPLFTDGRRCVSCWRLGWLDRVRVLFTGRVWLSVLGRLQPPVALATKRPDDLNS